MKGFIELHELYGNKPLMLNVKFIDYIEPVGLDNDVKIHTVNSIHRVRESYAEIIDKIKQAREE